ncbi:uncharacterized protein LOC131166955 [Malania oleifera]|uniref:uncharacterized protein LOC131166955 n=1 Tax=Malania oleifera TaxID=397392 RepID=UPI0025AEA80D|nr:uncharacterized protein LOC131166955 [Malania oleifera]
MDRWCGILKVPVSPNGITHCRVAASLCLSPTSKRLAVPSANAIFFNGDRVEGTGNPVIERLSDLQNIAEILVSKFGGSINAWVVEAPMFNGPFALYKEFIPSVNQWGEPKLYSPIAFPASVSTVTLLSNCLQEAKNVISEKQKEASSKGASVSQFSQRKTYLLGFSKGGTVLNQLVTELGFSEVRSSGISPNTGEPRMRGEPPNIHEENQIIPNSKESLLNSVTEIHYVDVGLNSAGAYLTDGNVIERISKRLVQGAEGIRFVLHGTPRQWCDQRRVLIQNEKNRLVQLLESAAQMSGGKLQVHQRFYFADRPSDLQMHFEIIENLDVS